jgi:hypothetical protein
MKATSETDADAARLLPTADAATDRAKDVGMFRQCGGEHGPPNACNLRQKGKSSCRKDKKDTDRYGEPPSLMRVWSLPACP